MAETNNAISLLVQLGVDTASSKDNLNAQIEKLSAQLNKLDIKVDIDRDAIKALNELSKVDLKGLSDTIKGAGKGIGGLGDEAKNAGNEIKKSFVDVRRDIEATFSHLSKDFQQAMSKGIVSVHDLEKAYEGMQAKFKYNKEFIGFDDNGKAVEAVKKVTVEYKNLQGQIERTNYSLSNSRVMMPDGSEKNLFLPENIVSVVDSQMKQLESAVSKSVQKTQEELNKLVRTGEITEQQFYELSEASNKIAHPNSLHLYNQRLTETLNSNKQLTVQKKEQLAVEERIRKLQNSIITAQARDPKGMGSSLAVNGMLDTLNKIDPASKGATESVKGVSDSFDKLKAEATKAGRESMSVLDSFKVAMEKFPIWMAASTIFFQSVRGIKDAVQQIVTLDTQATIMKRVASDGINVEKTLEKAVDLAGKLGNEIADVNEGFIAFARQGFRGEDLDYLAEYATLLSNISEMNVEEASSILTAALKGFNLEVAEASRVVDALNEVD